MPSAVIVLAAGMGTRMRSSLPKVLHRICGRPLLGHALVAAAGSGTERIVVVCGSGRDQVRDYLAQDFPTAITTVQEQQNGTGHAVRVTLDQLSERSMLPSGGPVVVISGDSPLLTAATIDRLCAAHIEARAAVTILSAILDDPTGYGRIVRDPAGAVLANVEHKDADDPTLTITEVNSGMYAFDPDFLADAVHSLSSDNAQGEQYLPDLIGIARQRDLPVAAVAATDASEIAGVNDRAHLARCGRVLSDRINTTWMAAGVTMVDPATTYVDSTVTLAPDVTLEPGVHLRGACEIESGAVIGPDTTLIDTEVGEGARIVRSHGELAVIGSDASVGPFTYLRPGARLERGARAGSYVEIKNSVVGEGSKVPHLSYIGDATIGRHSNVGASSVTVNYDGVSKHRTVIGDDVRIGSDTMLIAPVTVGDGAYTAAGSVITQDIEAGALGIARGRQRNVSGWVERRAAARADVAAADESPEQASTRSQTTRQEGDVA